MKYVISCVVSIIIIGFFSALTHGSAKVDQQEKPSLPLGDVVKVEHIKIGRGFDATRITTAAGKTFTVHGIAQGLEGAKIEYFQATSGREEVCGGLPRFCYIIAH